MGINFGNEDEWCQLQYPHIFSLKTLSVLTDAEVKQETAYNKYGIERCGQDWAAKRH